MVNAADLKSAAAKAACGFEPHARHCCESFERISGQYVADQVTLSMRQSALPFWQMMSRS
jgi:hypothetical protein